MIGNPGFHSWRHTQGLVNSPEMIVHVVERHRGNVILNLLREGIGQTSEPAHGHSHGQILPLDIACADVLRIGVAKANDFLLPVAHGRAAALLALGRIL